MSADFVLYSFHFIQNCFAAEIKMVPRETDGHSRFIQYVCLYIRLRGPRIYVKLELKYLLKKKMRE